MMCPGFFNPNQQERDMSLLDPKWKYTHSTATDIRKTFAKARRELAKRQQAGMRGPKLQLMRPPANTATLATSGRARDALPQIDKRLEPSPSKPRGFDARRTSV